MMDLHHEAILDKWKKQAKEIKETKDAFATLVASACQNNGRGKNCHLY